MAKISINMEIMFKVYLDLNQEQLKSAVLQGKVQNKIVRPFLTTYERIKKDSGYIYVKYSQSDNKKVKQITKAELLRILRAYKPKVDLQQEIQENYKKNAKIYEEMYKKYEKTPFEEDKKVEEVIPERHTE